MYVLEVGRLYSTLVESCGNVSFSHQKIPVADAKDETFFLGDALVYKVVEV